LIEQGSLACGKTLADLNIRKQYSVSILAVKRQQRVIENPSGEMNLQAGDEAIVMGAPDNISNLVELFRTPEQEK
jgi:CPA2 family monovalent cation:H+ antiporter-2